jgi:hypothetical protein
LGGRVDGRERDAEMEKGRNKGEESAWRRCISIEEKEEIDPNALRPLDFPHLARPEPEVWRETVCVDVRARPSIWTSCRPADIG